MQPRTLRLPISVTDREDRWLSCAKCIEERLSARPGIRSAAVSRNDHGDGFLAVDYDPNLLSLGQINRYLQSLGSCIGPSVSHLVLSVRGIASARHEQRLQQALHRMPGVRCSASYSSQTVRIEFDSAQTPLRRITDELARLGVSLHKDNGSDVMPAPLHPREASVALPLPRLRWLATALAESDILMAMLAGAFLLAGFLVHVTGGPEQIRIALLLVSYVCGGFFPAQDMLRTLGQFRLDIDVLMFAAAFGAAALGHYEEGAMLLFLFSLGGAGERLALNRARHAIQALAQLAPQTAQLIQPDGAHRAVPVEELRIGDHVFVAPGQQVPADGEIVEGRSDLDQSPITGESVPVDKVAGDEVFAGSINGEGALTVRVARLAADNTLAKVIRLVQEAQTTKSPTQLFTARVEKWYVPLVVLATVLIAVVPALLNLEPQRAHSSHWAGWFYQAMAFLTAASPCALAIGTPAAVLSGIARAARSGVLVKGGVHLENLGRVRAVAFDKTGTLTLGRPQVTDVVSLADELSGTDLLALMAAVERGSTHPIARAIIDAAAARGCDVTIAQAIDQTPGVGIQGVVNGRLIRIGRVALFAAELAKEPTWAADVAALEAGGQTVVAAADADRLLGLVSLADQPRPGAAAMLDALRDLGIRHTIMLTGDNARTAAAVAAEVGIDAFRADLLPQYKLEAIRGLDEQFGRVAMVGDGVNDAPALASATVGIAIGGAAGAASDVALETADVVLLGSHLNQLPHAIAVSRFARRIILQNLVIALGVIAVLAPMAALGQTPISTAVLFHEGSTVLVVLNALRILAYR